MSSSPGGLLPPLDPNPSGQNGNTRIMTTAAIMMVVFMGFNFLAPKTPPEDKPAKDATPTLSTNAAETLPLSTETDPDAPAPVGTPDTLAEVQIPIAVDVAHNKEDALVSGGFDAVLTNRGAQFSQWQLTGYTETRLKDAPKDAPQEPVDIAKGASEGARFGALRSRGGDVDLKADAPYEVVEQGPRVAVFSRLTRSGVRITRRYDFESDTFSAKLTTTLKNESNEQKTASLDMVLAGKERPGERESGGMFSVITDKLGGSCVVGEDRENFTSKEVSEDDAEDHAHKGLIRSATVDRHYFVGAVTFDGIPTDGCAAKPWAVDDVNRGVSVVISLFDIPLQPDEQKSFAQDLYLGPKQLDALRAFGHGQEEAIDFGMLAVISRPLLWLLVQIHAQTHDYGLAIIGLTVLLFVVTFPLTHRSQVEMKKFSKVMKDLKPDLDKLKEKYGHDQRVMMEKQQNFFKEKGVNPFANLLGCLPMLISMPVWFALYRTLSTSVELYQQSFLGLVGIADLTQPDVVLFGFPLLPFIVCALMFVSTLQQPPPDDQPQMKYMMYGMPLFFCFIMFNMASGLSIYMITNSIMRTTQSYYIKKKHG